MMQRKRKRRRKLRRMNKGSQKELAHIIYTL